MSAIVRCGSQGGSWVSVINNLASSSLLLTPQICIQTRPTHKCSHSHINKHEEGGRQTNRHKGFYLLERGLRVSQLQRGSLLGRLKSFNLGEISATGRQGLIKLAKRATLVPDEPKGLVFSAQHPECSREETWRSIHLDVGTSVWQGQQGGLEMWGSWGGHRDDAHVPPVSSSSQERVRLK